MYLPWPIFKISTAHKSQLNSVDTSTDIYVLFTKFLWEYTYMFLLYYKWTFVSCLAIVTAEVKVSGSKCAAITLRLA